MGVYWKGLEQNVPRCKVNTFYQFNEHCSMVLHVISPKRVGDTSVPGDYKWNGPPPSVGAQIENQRLWFLFERHKILPLCTLLDLNGLHVRPMPPGQSNNLNHKAWGSKFKNAYELLKCQCCIKIIYFNVCVRYFVRNFKGYLGNSTQNILLIHWKMYILLTGDNLRALRFKCFETPPPPPPLTQSWNAIEQQDPESI